MLETFFFNLGVKIMQLSLIVRSVNFNSVGIYKNVYYKLILQMSYIFLKLTFTPFLVICIFQDLEKNFACTIIKTIIKT